MRVLLGQHPLQHSYQLLHLILCFQSSASRLNAPSAPSARQLESSDYTQAYQLLLLFAYGTWADFKGAHLDHASQRLAALLPVPSTHWYASCFCHLPGLCVVTASASALPALSDRQPAREAEAAVCSIRGGEQQGAPRAAS